jgi:hypothetical protein
VVLVVLVSSGVVFGRGAVLVGQGGSFLGRRMLSLTWHCVSSRMHFLR